MSPLPSWEQREGVRKRLLLWKMVYFQISSHPQEIRQAILGADTKDKMKKIPLSQGKFAIVDDDKFDWLNQWKWCVSKSGNSYYAKAWIGGKMIRMHRLILKAMCGQQVDHKNHNTLDNRITNIRLCNNSQNQQNSRKFKNGTNKYKGVHLFKLTGKWEVQICFNKARHHLGYFDSDVKAAKAYDAKAKQLFGEFAYCNFK